MHGPAGNLPQKFLNLFVSREYGSGCQQKKAPLSASAACMVRKSPSRNGYDTSFKMGHFTSFSEKNLQILLQNQLD